MRVLVLGSGGREHSLAWKIKQSLRCEKVYLHPGNAGTLRLGIESLGDTPADKAEEIATKAEQLGVHLVVIGPEALLAQGYGDLFRKRGFLVFGPDQYAAQLESSKIFSKEFMDRARVPTASYFIAEDDRALMTLASDRNSFPVVLKLDGLAAGKGVAIAQNRQEIVQFVDRVYKYREFGDGPHRVLVEEHIAGHEISYIGLCDGKRFMALASATDYKRLNDDQEGPNTGGMGAISPSPHLDDALRLKIETRIVEPVLAQMQKEKLEYRGALFIGLMIDYKGDPQVLEFNARFGDPETQSILLRLDSDLIDYLEATAKKTLSEMPDFQWSSKTAVYVVASAEGYPSQVHTGDEITGWDAMTDATLFFSGVKWENNRMITSGGRVLGVGALGADRNAARATAYKNLSRIMWRGMHYRKDIGG